MLCADTEKPERQPVLQGPMNIVTCAAIVFTMTRWNRTHMLGQIHQSCLMQTSFNTSLFTNRQHAATQRAAETPELLQDRLQTPVRRSTTAAPYTELAHNYQNLLTPIISIRCIHYLYHVIIQKPEIHRPREHYWRQPDPTGSTPNGRSLHISYNAAQSVLRQYYKKMLQLYTLIPHHREIPMTDAPTERPSETQVRLHYAVRRLTMRKKLSATSLAVATSAITLKTLRKYNRTHPRNQKMPDTYSLPKKAEHPR
jgi:hypothetical protein